MDGLIRPGRVVRLGPRRRPAETHHHIRRSRSTLMSVEPPRPSATMARMTISRRAPPTRIAAVGLNPKIALRSVAARGSAEPPSLRPEESLRDSTVVLRLSVFTSAFTSDDGLAGSLLGLAGSLLGAEGAAFDGTGDRSVCATPIVTRPNRNTTLMRAEMDSFMS